MGPAALGLIGHRRPRKDLAVLIGRVGLGKVAQRRVGGCVGGGQALRRRRDLMAHRLSSECHPLVVGHDLIEIPADAPSGRQVDGVE